MRLIGRRLERKEGRISVSTRWVWGSVGGGVGDGDGDGVWIGMDWYRLVWNWMVWYSLPQGGRRFIKHRVMGVRRYSFVLLAWCLELTAYFCLRTAVSWV